MIYFKLSMPALGLALSSLVGTESKNPSLRKIILEIPEDSVRGRIERAYMAGNFDEVESDLMSYVDEYNFEDGEVEDVSGAREMAKEVIHEQVGGLRADALTEKGLPDEKVVENDMPRSTIPEDMRNHTVIPSGMHASTPEDMRPGMPEDMRNHTVIPSGMHAGMPEDMRPGMPKDMRNHTIIPSGMHTSMPEDMYTGMPEDMYTGMPEDMYTDMPEDMYTGMPSGMHTSMPEDMRTDMPMSPSGMRTDNLVMTEKKILDLLYELEGAH